MSALVKNGFRLLVIQGFMSIFSQQVTVTPGIFNQVVLQRSKLRLTFIVTVKNFKQRRKYFNKYRLIISFLCVIDSLRTILIALWTILVGTLIVVTWYEFPYFEWNWQSFSVVYFNWTQFIAWDCTSEWENKILENKN